MQDVKTPAYNQWILDFLFGKENAEKGVTFTPDDLAAHLSVPLKEKEVCAELRKYWKDNGFFYIRNQQGIGSTKGLADYTVIKNGYVLFVEAKATTGKQSTYQKDFQAKVEAAGGKYLLVHSLGEFLEGWKCGSTG